MSTVAVKNRKFKPIRKNDPHAVEFRLVSRARDFEDKDDEVVGSGTYTWERVPFGKHEPKGVPRDVYMGLSPQEFGIYPHLSRAEHMRLCLEIYGQAHIPKEVADKFDKVTTADTLRTNASRNGECGDDGDDDGVDDLFDETAADAECADLSEGELDFVMQQFGKDCVVQVVATDDDAHGSAEPDSVAAPKVPYLIRSVASKGGHSKADSDMSHLETDCYFPVDGYNYQQHLRTVGLGGGTFIAAHVDKHNPPPKVETKRHNDVDEFSAELLCTDEGRELLAALQVGGDMNTDEAFVLAEDFATQADGVDERVEKEMLWGAHGEAYWHSTGKKTTTVNTRALTITREERAAMLDANKHAQASDEDSDDSDDDFERLLENGPNKDTDKIENFDLAFDKILADYEDDMIGELDADDPEVLADNNAEFADYDQMFEDFLRGNTEKNQVWVRHLKVHNDPTDNALPPRDKEHNELTLQYLLRDAETASVNGSTDEESEPAEPQWDCETVLTTRSSVCHHPQRIGRPPASKVKVQTKLKVPFEGLTLEQQNSVKSLAQTGMVRDAKSQHTGNVRGLVSVLEEESGDEVITLPAVQHRRLDGETPDERRERKKLVKQTQREVRRLKAESKKSIKNLEQDVRTKLSQKNAYDIREGTRHFRYT